MTRPTTDPPSAPSPLAPRAALVAAWVLIGLVELYFAHNSASPPGWLWSGLEIGGLLLIGAAHAALTRGDWRGSIGLPGAVAVYVLLLRSDQLVPAIRIGAAVIGPVFVVMGARVVHSLTAKLPRWLAVVLVTALFLPPMRLLALRNGKVARARGRFIEDLSGPLTALADRHTATGPPVVVLTVDTLRADYAVRMKTWSRLAERGRTWDDAMSTSSWTVPAVASLWTGLLPGEHKAGRRAVGDFMPIAKSASTLAEELQRRGYHTGAFVANPFVAGSIGFRRGFDDWMNPDERVFQPYLLLGDVRARPGRDAAQVVDHALQWLDSADDSGWMLWVHLFDTHLPYAHLPEDHLAREVLLPGPVRSGRQRATGKLRRAVREGYQIEVDYVDGQLERVLDALEARGFFKRGTLIFSSDHGEEFWEHRGYEHGHSHHVEVTEVPMAVVSPGVPAGPGPGAVSLIDVTPTLRAVTGMPPGPGEGLDLRGEISSARVVKAAGNLYGATQTSARDPAVKCIETRDGRSDALKAYDRTTDPRERSPQPPGAAPSVCAAAHELPDGAGSGEVRVDLALEQLCALGYVECAGAPTAAPEAAPVTPAAPPEGAPADTGAPPVP